VKETQSSIESWRLATFGTVSPQLIAARMNVEVAELLLELARPNPSVKKIEGECADVLIVLYGICEAYGIELHNAVDRKMAVNRGRTWDVRDGVGQHLRTSTICSVCRAPQFTTRSGVTCENGHGDAPPLGFGQHVASKEQP
jgi:NTP pyrophosphatase (non-canonical NTP hydrolase)